MCDNCSSGTYGTAKGYVFASDCSACNVFFYQPFSGKTHCTECPNGTFYVNSTSCNLCAKGKFRTTGENQNCLQCKVGFYASSEGSSVCNVCEVGKYFSGFGATACVSCDTGTFATALNGKCELCAQGKYSTTASASSEL